MKLKDFLSWHPVFTSEEFATALSAEQGRNPHWVGPSQPTDIVYELRKNKRELGLRTAISVSKTPP
ncbi:MAG: hypothetical protein ACE5H0_13025 [Bacteroidota bacterium]